MNIQQRRTIQMIAGIAMASTVGMLSKQVFSKTKIEKRSRQLSIAIDQKLQQDKKILEQVREHLEAQLTKVNAKIEQLANETA